MIDFTSALYLGMRHAHWALPPWLRLTTGRPAALEEPPEANRLSQDIARLLRCERAILAPSTLHLFWDLFDVLASRRIAIYVDAGTCPIARWGIERANAKGIPVAEFPEHDPDSLEALLRRDRAGGRHPVVVTDGLCAETGRTAPLADYLALVRKNGGRLVIDDTQALGVLGGDPSDDAPYGHGGGGTPAWRGIEAPELITGSSLAKGFGAPLAVIAGAATVISNLESLGATRIHCSPPSLASIGAAHRALAINNREGDVLRARLAKLVRHFKAGLRRVGLSAQGGLFPIQTLKAIEGVEPEALHRRLLDLGIGALLHRSRSSRRPILSFLITAAHTRADIGRCIDALWQVCALRGVRREIDQPMSTQMLSIPA
jgi:8-amino-7-oxononanoate synthase